MQYIYENFTFPPNQSFTARSEVLEIKKYASFRCHVNFEIALLENCMGKRFIGDSIMDFEGTELLLLGSYLPHCWQYYGVIDPAVQPQATVVHFFPDFLGSEFLLKPECAQLNELLAKAPRGISFTGPTIVQARMVLQQLLFEANLGRISLMLRLLDILAQSTTYKILSSPFFNNIETSGEAQKINQVFEYIFRNFKKEIALKEVADILSISPSAFCRFFKARTNRTLIDFVKEVRIGHAAKLLLQGQHNVSETCYESGYNNISNFNKHFREIKGFSPREFVRRYEAQMVADGTAYSM